MNDFKHNMEHNPVNNDIISQTSGFVIINKGENVEFPVCVSNSNRSIYVTLILLNKNGAICDILLNSVQTLLNGVRIFNTNKKLISYKFMQIDHESKYSGKWYDTLKQWH